MAVAAAFDVVVSPTWELVMSVRALTRRRLDPLHRGWAEDARRRLAGEDIHLLPALVRDATAIPHFLCPPPIESRPTFDGELDRIANLRTDEVLTELGWAFGELFWQDPARVVPRSLRTFIDDPEHALERLTDELRVWWRVVFGTRWETTAEFLDWNAERLAAAAPTAAFWGRVDPSYSLDVTVSSSRTPIQDRCTSTPASPSHSFSVRWHGRRP